MDPVELIIKKRNGGVLSEEEIRGLIEGYTSGAIPDYQISALLMAIYFQKLNEEETIALTMAMRDSGDSVTFPGIKGIKVDKHSTGGVGDKTTLIVGPLVAACGVPVTKMSGRGLGFTGGTLDKLESIPGFSTTMTKEEFSDRVRRHGIAIAGQSEDVAKADKLLYALRDVTGTVDNIGLIASSIMSKKLAVEGDAIVLDVKFGKGAFMKTQEEAAELAAIMEKIGRAAGRSTLAVLTNMDQPLGQAVGNSVEVAEAIRTLKGHGPEDLTKLCLYLATLMVFLSRKAAAISQAEKMVREALESGAALDKFRELIESQGGNGDCIRELGLLPRPKHTVDIVANKDGYVAELDAEKIGNAARKAGAGRLVKTDLIDPAAGIFLYKKIGDEVSEGERLARVFGNEVEKIKDALLDVEEAFRISPEPVEAPELIIR